MPDGEQAPSCRGHCLQNAPGMHTVEEVPSGDRHRTHKTVGTHTGERAQRRHRHRHKKQQAHTQLNKRAGTTDTAHTRHQAHSPDNKRKQAPNTAHSGYPGHTPVNKRQEATGTAHTTHQAHTSNQWTSANRPRTLHTQHTKRAHRSPSAKEQSLIHDYTVLTGYFRASCGGCMVLPGLIISQSRGCNSYESVNIFCPGCRYMIPFIHWIYRQMLHRIGWKPRDPMIPEDI